jgi:bifunctional non-homologous end joining protein LigD
LKVHGYPKTSGASGIHIFIPLAPGTPYDAGQIFCQIVATVVSEKHPKIATIVRSVHARGQKVYVDYLQNIEGKSLACAYSARASEFAGASTPLTWAEIDEGVNFRTVWQKPATCGSRSSHPKASTFENSPGPKKASFTGVARASS